MDCFYVTWACFPLPWVVISVPMDCVGGGPFSYTLFACMIDWHV